MENEHKVITYEQLIAAALLMYGKEISSKVIIKILALFRKELGNGYLLMDSPLTHLEKYIERDIKGIRLIDGIDFSTTIKDNFTIKNELAILAGNDALGYIDFLCNKGCLNCMNPTCSVPSYEKNGLDEMKFPEGNECIGWENKQYEQKILTYGERQYLYK